MEYIVAYNLTTGKIDAFAYMLLQDFGNAFSIYVAQNYGVGFYGKIKKGQYNCP